MTDLDMMLWTDQWERHFFAERYSSWRSAFYAERSRRMEGGCFAIVADSDAEAIYLLTHSPEGE